MAAQQQPSVSTHGTASKHRIVTDSNDSNSNSNSQSK
jgi:hypothetical protein